MAEDGGRFLTAEKMARKAVMLGRKRAAGYIALGYVNLRGGRLEDGYRYLMKAKHLAPKDPRVRTGFALYDHQRPPVISDLSRIHPVNRALGGTRAFLESPTNRAVALAFLTGGPSWPGLCSSDGLPRPGLTPGGLSPGSGGNEIPAAPFATFASNSADPKYSHQIRRHRNDHGRRHPPKAGCPVSSSITWPPSTAWAASSRRRPRTAWRRASSRAWSTGSAKNGHGVGQAWPGGSGWG